jgi:GNAT superfamily N-acetyltransferase
VTKAVSVLRDQYATQSMADFVGFLRDQLFKQERLLVYARSLDDIALDARAGEGAVVVKGTAADLERTRGRLRPVPWEFQCDVYDGVRDFFVHRDDGEVGHISWLYYAGDPNRFLRLGDAECEVKFCLTLPQFRGKGLYPTALREIQRYLKRQGYKRCFICVRDNNLPSIQGIEKAGFQRVGAVHLRRALGWQISRRLQTSHLGRA